MSSSYVNTTSGFLADFNAGERTLRNTTPMMRGEDVQFVQLRVGAAPDSIFGPKTKAAVKRFQQSKGLSVTGIVNKATWAELHEAPSAADRQSFPAKSSQSGKNSLLYWGAAGVAAIGLAALTAKILNS